MAANPDIERTIRELDYDCRNFLVWLENEVDGCPETIRRENGGGMLEHLRAIRAALADAVVESLGVNRQDMEAELTDLRALDLGAPEAQPNDVVVEPAIA